MPPQRQKLFSMRKMTLVAIGLGALAVLIYKFYPASKQDTGSTNSIFIISPYRYGGTWVFDDPGAGLVKEPFVAGIPQLIDKLVEDIPDADKGFRLLFSSKPFPGHTAKLIWRREQNGGNWYYSEEFDLEGWLCPALFKYFKKAPREIYIKAERK